LCQGPSEIFLNSLNFTIYLDSYILNTINFYLQFGNARQSRFNCQDSWPIRLALPYRRARGQRDDATLSQRAGPAGSADADKLSRN